MKKLKLIEWKCVLDSLIRDKDASWGLEYNYEPWHNHSRGIIEACGERMKERMIKRE